ncbi:RCC1 domain-containing protein [Longimicrobium terrae]|uniref:Alpha-tubulin suppressor-like RCC1 family protein n=1 Tax=Longimicrobium terrae TaxID=1639882 RepID=A0A841H356_9BACT|nr:hypothetical protein [Longimicrobium terrae]MBB4638317.1 alpha-tubulin suppressor-like RCC1 family protein [Longimicrobium terrae]MBB6072615.1 alpha-tubulin suppressor-like RCC1 family protein [Longimicrobium terrae]NNC28606.1 hypothetical protein [Longimicrobium terrae]
MRRPSPSVRACAAAVLSVLAACADSTPVAPVEAGAPAPLVRMDCTASVRARSLRCEPGQGGAAGVSTNLIVGGQGVYVRMGSANTAYDGSAIFQADVTVQNLLGQPMGTTDGVTVDPGGIQVFFASGPAVTSGTGSVEVDNEDGTADFLGGDAPYFRYVERLTTEQTSAARQWRFSVPATVQTFAFSVYVSAPVPQQNALRMIDTKPRTLAAGGFHSCGLVPSGDGFCWGPNDDGQLGRGAPDSVPRPVDRGYIWRTIAGGRFHTCGITRDDVAYCWGDNQTGQLGDGLEDDNNVPSPVEGGRSWQQMDAGAGHTCGVTTAGQAFCWGDNNAGQLGVGHMTNTRVPEPVSGGRVWVAVDAGTDHSCGITRGGAAFCWGDDSQGELGTGGGPSTVPVLVAGNHSWRSVTAGEDYSCGVTSLGVAMCWGSDLSGRLGNGAAPDVSTPQPVDGEMEWAWASAGRETSCGITTAGAAYCWGDNGNGEVGDGTEEDRDAPAAVPGAGQNVTQIDNGDYHTCSVNAAGSLRCWGYNAQGQLGNNSTATSFSPVAVSGVLTWAP